MGGVGAGGEGILTQEKPYLESACRTRPALWNEAIAQGYEGKKEQQRGASGRLVGRCRSTRIRPYRFNSLSWIDSARREKENRLLLFKRSKGGTAVAGCSDVLLKSPLAI